MQVEPEMLLIYNDLGIQGQLNIKVSMTIFTMFEEKNAYFSQKYRNSFEKNL